MNSRDEYMERMKILLAGCNEPDRSALSKYLAASGCESIVTDHGKQTLELISTGRIDLLITDPDRAEMDALTLLSTVKETTPDVSVILITDRGHLSENYTSKFPDICHLLIKPFEEDKFLKTLENIASQKASRKKAPEKTGSQMSVFGNIIGVSDAMQDIFGIITKVSKSDSTIVIYGESGTGKELVARAIHFCSDREKNPIIPVNCGAIPEDLLESELFGHEKGAFTGAIRNRPGRFELAQEGTIFLDEIGDMSPSLQVKLLRVIQERNFERIGGIKTIEADVRIIAATNQNLEQAVTEKKFREDLFYRLNVIPIHLPPLRQRGDDIMLLVNHFLKKFNDSKKKQVTGLSPEVIRIFMGYPWPGNVRELENLMEMLVVMKEEGEITVEDLPRRILQSKGRDTAHDNDIVIPDEGINFNEIVEQFEKDLLLKALKKTEGVKNRAAKLLNLNRTTLVEKLKRYNLTDHDEK
jgi:DNA-binding NtrC family response regulator